MVTGATPFPIAGSGEAWPLAMLLITLACSSLSSEQSWSSRGLIQSWLGSGLWSGMLLCIGLRLSTLERSLVSRNLLMALCRKTRNRKPTLYGPWPRYSHRKGGTYQLHHKTAPGTSFLTGTSTSSVSGL